MNSCWIYEKKEDRKKDWYTGQVLFDPELWCFIVKKTITCFTDTVRNFNFLKDSMHVTLRPTIAWFLKEFDFYDFWTKKNNILIGWFVLNGWTVMCMSSLQHLFKDILRQYKDSPGDLFKSEKNYKGEWH